MDINQARFNMVEQQVRPWEVLDPAVLDAMMTIPRELFVPDDYQQLAFSDTRIPLGFGQTMLAPKCEGRVLQALSPTTAHRALEIGTGSGYLAALLGQLCREVVSVEIQPEFVTPASRKLRLAGLTNVQLESGDGLDGWPARGPYDLIAVTGSVPLRRAALEQQLVIGGRLFLVIGTGPAMEACVITRQSETHFELESLFEIELAPLRGAAQKPTFKF